MKTCSASFGAGALCVGLFLASLLPAAGPGPAPDVLSTANYAFATATTGSLADLTGSTQLIGPSQLDYSTPLTPIGFDFYLRGVRYSQFSVNANGLLQLGSIAQTGSPYRPLAQANKPLLTPYGASLRLHSTGKVHYRVLGSAPARTLVVEWRNVQSIPVPGGDPDLTFQAQLDEGTGVIRFVYGTMNLSPSVGAVPDTAMPHIGFSTSDLAGTVGSVGSPQAGSPFYNGSSATPQANNYTGGPLTSLTSAADGSRRVLTFTPPVPPPPTNLSFSAVTLSGMTLSWSDAAGEQGYALYASTDGIFFNYFGTVGENVTSYAASDLATTTTYHWRVYSISEGALSATPLAGSQATLAGAFSGTYTVGPGGNYASIGAAVAAFIAGGTTGSVTLDLLPAYLGSVETYPLTVGRIPGATLSTPVIVRPAPGASGLSLSSAASTTLDLNGSRGVVFEGRPGGAGTTPQLTIANTSTSGVAVRFRNDASRNILRYVTAAGVHTAATGGVILFDTTTGTTGNDDNLIDSCVVRDGATTPTNGIASLGTTTTQAHYNSGNTVLNSSILNFFSPTVASRGVLLSSGSTDWTIQGNSLYQTAARTGSATVVHAGISVENTSGHGFLIADNVIGGSAPNAAGAPWTLGPLTASVRFRGIGISAGFERTTSVQGNTITNFVLNTAATQVPLNGGNFSGLYLNAGDLAVGTVAGNTIGAATGTGAITLTSNFGGTSVGIVTNSNGVQPTIANNQIGSITVLGSSNTVSHSFQGISLAAGSIAGTIPIVGNTIGSSSTPNSVQTATPSTSATVQSLLGISLTAGSNVSVVGNVIANLQNNYAPASTVTTRVLGGIVCTASIPSIVGNTIYNLGTGADATGTGLNAGVVGILQNATAGASTNISQNHVHSLANTHPSAATSVIGLRQNSSPSFASLVSRNHVHSLSVSSNSPAATVVGLAAAGGLNSYQNNFIALGYDAAGNPLTNGLVLQGLHHAAGDNCTFYHNSIALGGTGVGGANDTFGFQSDVATVLRDIRNNTITNTRSNGSGTGSHYAVQVGGSGVSPAGLTMDYNLIYHAGAGTVFGRYNGAPVASLTDWRAATGVDLNSLFGNPNFLQPAGNALTVDLHIQPGGSPVEGNGTPLAAVTIDYDGQSRAALTPTDIGADAGNFAGGDLQPPRFAFTPLPDTTATAARTLRAFVYDLESGVPLSGASLPLLHWRTESTGCTAVTAVPQGGGYYDFTFGGGVALGAKVSYYLTAQDLAPTPNVTAIPLAGAGGFTASPPVAATPPTTPYSYTVRHPMAGTFTVGTGGAFATLGSAVDYLNRSFLTGPTTLVLTDATYPVLTQPLVFEPNPGSSPTNTVTIRPGSVAVTIEGSGEHVFQVQGADYLSFAGENGDGPINFTVKLTNPNPFTSIISIENLVAAGFIDPANHILLSNLHLEGAGTTGYAIFSGGLDGGPPPEPQVGNCFRDNAISGVQVGICTYGAGPNDKGLGTRIEGNSITGTGNPAARIGILAGYEDRLTVSGNRIENLAQTSGTRDSIGIALGADDFFASPFGFPHFQCSNVIVQGNRIGTISHSANRSAIGIAVGPTGAGTTDLSNNAIHSVLSNATETEVCAGIYVLGQNLAGSTTQIIANSISLTGSLSGGTTPVYGLAFGVGDPAVLLRNNTVQVLAANGSTGSGGGSVAIASSVVSPSNLNSNWNNFFVTAAGNYQVGRVGATSLPTLANWQGATGGDANSLSVAPQHQSATNLAPAGGSPLLGAGLSLAGALADLLGFPRPNPPAIGAYEAAQSSGLSNLVLAPGALVPGFETGRLGFDARIPNGVTAVTVTPTAEMPGSTITVKVNGGSATPVTSGSPSAPLSLQVGVNRLELQVMPPSGPPPPPTVVNCTREGQLVCGDLERETFPGTPLTIPFADILAASTVGAGVAPVTCSTESTSTQGGTVTNTFDAARYLPLVGTVGRDQFRTFLVGRNGEVSTGKVGLTISIQLASLASLLFEAGNVKLAFHHLPTDGNYVYRVEFSDDLTQGFTPLIGANGQPLFVRPDSNGFGAIEDPTPVTAPQTHKFYRLVTVFEL